MKKILVAVDGSDSGFRALMRGHKLGSAFKSNLTILNVIDDPVDSNISTIGGFSDYRLLMEKNLKKESENLLDSYMEHFKAYPGQVDTLILFGNPANKIIELSEKEGYDLIIVGSRGLGTFAGAMLGSISNKVVNKSKVDVLTVQ